MSKKDDERKACFIHIPKNAGMSIETVISGHGHESIVDYFGVSGENLGGWNISAIVRNPYDRAVSIWAHGVQLRDCPFEWPEKFRDFVYALPRRLWWTHARPQYTFLLTKKGISANHILRYEELDEAYQTICGFHGIENPPELPHVNQSERNRNLICYYDSDLIRRINDIYWDDFRYFGYQRL